MELENPVKSPLWLYVVLFVISNPIYRFVTALLTALAQRIIPGLGKQIRILLLSQIDDHSDAVKADIINGDELSESSKETVVEHVIKGDVKRCAAVANFKRE
jgi:hypothetical protein